MSIRRGRRPLCSELGIEPRGPMRFTDASISQGRRPWSRPYHNPENEVLVYFHTHNGEITITSFVFINIMERSISDIFCTFVFNNIMEDTCISPPRFSRPAPTIEITILVSMTYVFARFSLIIANSFFFLYIMESRSSWQSRPLPFATSRAKGRQVPTLGCVIPRRRRPPQYSLALAMPRPWGTRTEFPLRGQFVPNISPYFLPVGKPAAEFPVHGSRLFHTPVIHPWYRSASQMKVRLICLVSNVAPGFRGCGQTRGTVILSPFFGRRTPVVRSAHATLGTTAVLRPDEVLRGSG